MAQFFLVFVLLFGLLMWPWPGLKTGYAAAYRAAGNMLLPTFGEHGRCEFVAASLPDADAEIVLRNLRTGSGARIGINTRLTAYVPTGLVVALALATPVSWKRKLVAFLIGLAAISVFVLLRAAVSILYTFSGMVDIPDLAIYAPGKITALIISFGFAVLGVSAAGGFVIPILIWVLSTFRARDWDYLTKRVSARGPTGTSAIAPLR